MSGSRVGSRDSWHQSGDTPRSQIPLPPLDEQRRIVAGVEEQLSVIDALRAAIERGTAQLRSLRRAILERAFRGELVPQDPSDEPASVLLERIAAERAATPAEAAPRPTRPTAPVDDPEREYDQMTTEAVTTEANTRFDAPLYTVAEAARFLGVPSSTFGDWARGYRATFRPARRRRAADRHVVRVQRRITRRSRSSVSPKASSSMRSAGPA